MRLADLATVRVAAAPSVIEHEDISRFVDVTAEVKGRDVADVAADVARTDRQGPFPARAPRGAARRLREPPVGQHPVLRDPGGGGHRLLAAVPGRVRQLATRRRGAVRGTARALRRCPRRRRSPAIPGRSASSPACSSSVAWPSASVVCSLHRCQEIAQGNLAVEAPDVVQRTVGERLVPVLVDDRRRRARRRPALFAGSIAGLEVLHPAAIVMLGGMITAAVVNLVVVPAFAAKLGPRPTSHTTLDLVALERRSRARRRHPPDRRRRDRGRRGQGRLRCHA